jgi:DNA modification methylase
VIKNFSVLAPFPYRGYLVSGEKAVMPNHLYYGDNLAILREHIADESVDLVYLDPPFNSQADYNILFRAPSGEKSQAQIEAFVDTWHWTDEAEKAFDEVMHSGNADVAEMLRAMRSFLKENDMMAYLTMMAVRLLELHRVLKPTGSLYLHCDPTASHYLKVLLDAVFGKASYRTEISWKRSSAHNDAKQGRTQYGNIRDVIFFYTKSSDDWTWHWQYSAYDQEYVDDFYKHIEPETGRRYRLGDLTAAKPGGDTSYEFYGTHPYKGRYWAYSREKMEQFKTDGRLYFPSSGGAPSYKRYLDEMSGVPLQNDWGDVKPASGSERLGYPTQKPLALLERVLNTSSNEGDVVLDPFCGCGTSTHAAQKLNRQWIGIDITHLAISLIEKRLRDAFPGIAFDVHGTPKDIEGARSLAAADKYQFQWWAVSLVDAVPFGGKKKGADSGVDGFIYFKPDGKTTEKAIVSVKGGDNVSVPMIRDLGHVVDREEAKIGIFLTLTEPTGPMKTEAGKAGFYETEYGKYPKIQILTVSDLFAGKKPDIPLVDTVGFKKAKKEDSVKQKQGKLL